MAPIAVDVLCGIAETLALDSQAEKAAELLLFALQQPGLDQQTRQKASGLLERVQGEIAAERLAEIQSCGANRSLAEMVKIISL